MPFDFDAVAPFGTSLAIGALIGIERERKRLRAAEEERLTLPGGIRTFPLIALLGCASAWLGEHYGPVVFAVGLGGFSLLVVGIYVMTSLRGDLGATTEVAALLTFALGAMTQSGAHLLAGAIAVGATVLLSSRQQLHDLALRIDQEDLFAALTLAVVSIIILPVLPDRGFGPWEVWNPFKIWLLVVFISAIGFAGFVGTKLLGPGRGIAVAGFLGGVVSSTATTLTFAGRSKEQPALSPACTLAIAGAWAVMFVRLILEIAAANRALLNEVVPALGAAAVTGVVGAGFVALRAARGEKAEAGAQKFGNPFSLASALKFGLLFAATLLGAKAAQVYFKDVGVLVAAGLTGLLDVDAIALSVARLSKEGQLTEATAAHAVFLAAAANTLVKAFFAATLGSPALRRTLLPIAAMTLAVGGAVALVL